MIYKVTQQDIDYSSLEQSDLGKWFYLNNGCYCLFDTEEEARESYNYVFRSK